MRKAMTLLLMLALAVVAAPTSPAASGPTPTTVLDWESVLPDLPVRIWRSPHYQDDHILFVTTDRDLRRTTDEGETWTTLYPTPPMTETLGISALAFDPATPVSPTLFLARNPSGGPSEIRRSTDDALTWQTVFTTTDGPVRDLAAVRDGAEQLVVFAVGGVAQVWRSADGGDSWVPSASGVPDGYDVFGVFASPTFSLDSTVYLIGFGSLLRSTDGGHTWTEVDIPWVDLARHVTFSPQFASDDTLWVSYFWLEGSGGEYPPNGIVRSTDGGETWHPVNDGLPVDYPDGWIMGLDVSPDYPSDPALYAVERTLTYTDTIWALYRSPAGGDGWWWQGTAPDETPTGFLAVDPDLFFLPTTAGLWRLRTSCWEWVVNGSCESDAGWDMPFTPAQASYSTDQAHSGSRSIRVGIVEDPNRYAFSSALQLVSIPGTATAAEVSFWLYPTSSGTQLAHIPPQELAMAIRGSPSSTPVAGDAQYVLVRREGETDWQQLLWMRQDTRDWEQYTFDLSAYVGESIRLLFGVYNDGAGGITGMYVDDVSLTACERAPEPVSERVFLPLVFRDWQAPVPPAGPLLIDGEWVWSVAGHPQSETIYGLTTLGLYRSDDGARTWALMNPSPPVTENLKLAPSQPDVLYAGEGYPCFVGGPPVPMWKSEDGGQTWFELASGVNLEPLAVHPTDPLRVYARGCPAPWLTDDGGSTWIEQPDELFLSWHVYHSAPAPADNWQTLYMGCTSEGGSGAIIGSTNGGADWERLTPPEADPWWVSTLAVDPISPTHIYWTEPKAFWGSHDGGTTWFTSTNGLEEVVYDPSGPITQTYGLFSLAYVPSDLDDWLLGTVGGLYGSADRGQTWAQLTGPPWQDEEITDLLLRAVEPDKLFVTTPAGVYVYYLNSFP